MHKLTYLPPPGEPHIVTLGSVRFTRGQQREITDAQWAKVQSVGSPYQRFLESKPTSLPSPTVPSSTLSDYKAQEAIALVSETDDPAQLESWLAGENRATVRRAIEDQLTQP